MSLCAGDGHLTGRVWGCVRPGKGIMAVKPMAVRPRRPYMTKVCRSHAKQGLTYKQHLFLSRRPDGGSGSSGMRTGGLTGLPARTR